MITASSPLIINYYGGISLSVGYTSKLASLYSISLLIGSFSAFGIYPLKAVSSSLAYAKLVGKSTNTYPFFSIYLTY
jgi:hypothetical protein